MTFGEKFKAARKEAGLSQEQLATKLGVSRSAVAKWESGKGLPDVSNLKVIAQLLDVSIDYLLDEGEKLSFNETKKPLDLSSYTKSGACRDLRDAACFEEYRDADAIYPLIRTKKLSKAEWLADLIAGPGIVQMTDHLRDGSSYYLVEARGRQLLVSVSDDFMTTSELANKVDPKKFTLGSHTFKKAPYQLI